MGAIYLTDLANWLREVGLDVVEHSGWQHRARGSGGFDSLPLCVVWHHTASGPASDGASDANYIATGDANSPISNLYIDRSGRVWVIAAGATNTNGKGQSIKFSRGTVPVDGMNLRGLGVEMANNGVGEQWPQCQIDAMFLVSNTLNLHFGNQPDDLATHQFYATPRKIDPATAAAVQGPWKPSSINSSGSWSRADVQNEAVRRSTQLPTPGPDPSPPSKEVQAMGMFVLDSGSMGSAMLTVRADGSHFLTGFNSPDERNAWANVLPVVCLGDAPYQQWINGAS